MGVDVIKKRIRGINTTAKITNAMQLLASSKLHKQKELYLQIKDYYLEYFAFIGKLLQKHKINTTPSKNCLHIVINSELGLCGSYNMNIIKQTIKSVRQSDYLLQIGKRGRDTYSYEFAPSQILHTEHLSINNLEYNDCLVLAYYLVELLNNQTIDGIKLHYTKFINAITFIPTAINLIPFDEKFMSHESLSLTDFEPKYEEIITQIIPSYLASVIYGAIIESTISENASRRNAMDSATNNANDLIEKLQLKFNRERQFKITNEITEIISGSKD